MKKITITEKENNKKLISILQARFKNLPSSAIYKALRNKDIKVNSQRIKDNIVLQSKDEVEIYITDDIINNNLKTLSVDDISIVYEDDNILVSNKPQEIEVQGKNGEQGLEEILATRYGFIKACHRIDRNTYGLVIFAKNSESEEIMLKMIKDRAVRKFYKAKVWGIPKNKAMTLKAYLFKDNKQSKVIISDVQKKGYQEIITKYRLLSSIKEENTSILEVELVTGKTHQIRAHLAYIGYPIIGDGKYGINQVNKQFGKKYQELCSYKIVFENAYDKLEYLKNKEIKIN